MSSILDLNLVSILLTDLNEEIKYKISENTISFFTEELLFLKSDGIDHCIIFLGKAIYNSRLEQQLENIPLKEQMNLNERERFESHVRNLIMDRINILKHLEV